jgi:hypothetical protein
VRVLADRRWSPKRTTATARGGKKLVRCQNIKSAIRPYWNNRQSLAQVSKSFHRVPASNIKRKMDRWVCDLTVEDILQYKPAK